MVIISELNFDKTLITGFKEACVYFSEMEFIQKLWLSCEETGKCLNRKVCQKTKKKKKKKQKKKKAGIARHTTGWYFAMQGNKPCFGMLSLMLHILLLLSFLGSLLRCYFGM